MQKITAAILALLSALTATGCTTEEIIDNTAALLSEASVIMEEQESVSDEEEAIPEESEEAADEYAWEGEAEAEISAEESAHLMESSVLEEMITEESETDSQTVLEESDYSEAEETFDTELTIAEDGVYTSKEDVALYIHIYERLPDNFMTKKEAQALGWEGGSLEPYAPGMCIGGNRFGNYEGLLPEEDGRTYTECDIDTLGAKSRGAKRIVFSNDGLIYYTEDHYETFELLYGEE